MTFFIQLVEGVPSQNPINESNFRLLFPNTSFPTFFTAEAVEPLGYGVYDFSNQPELDRYQISVETLPVRNDRGIWRQTWQIQEMTAEQKLAADETKAIAMRQQRNQLLSACDWTQLPDAPVDRVVWATYRQELRDVTAQSGFPWEVVWPEKP
jgi:hypothetical protein